MAKLTADNINIFKRLTLPEKPAQVSAYFSFSDNQKYSFNKENPDYWKSSAEGGKFLDEENAAINGNKSQESFLIDQYRVLIKVDKDRSKVIANKLFEFGVKRLEEYVQHTKPDLTARILGERCEEDNIHNSTIQRGDTQRPLKPEDIVWEE